MARQTDTLNDSNDQEGRATAHASHPRVAVYWVVAGVLAVVTLVEVAVFYMEPLRRFLVPVLIALSAAKFSLVAGFYMHLRFDSPTFRRLFAVGIGGAIAIYAAVLAMFATQS